MKRTSSKSRLLIIRTRSFTSHVSYWRGINFTVGFGGRCRFGEDCEEPWLQEEEDWASVSEEDSAAFSETGGAGTGRVDVVCGSNAGSGGGRGGLGMAFRLPDDFGGSIAEGMG